MADRLDLHEILCDILGSRNVYFQPPPTIKIAYPAIIYSLSNVRKIYSDNKNYIIRKQYSIILIDKNPDTKISDKILELPYCSFDRFYISDGLNHYAHTIYY